MNVLIDISDEIYRHAKDRSEDSNDEWNVMRAIANGTPIPDNATFGDVIEKITNRKPLEDNKDADNIIISTKLWNAPYQRGGKE